MGTEANLRARQLVQWVLVSEVGKSGCMAEVCWLIGRSDLMAAARWACSEVVAITKTDESRPT